MSLTQLLWDGLGTRNDVARAGHEQLARYFELVDVTEQTAIEAARAHFDVQRFRRLVQLAEDNHVQHRYAYLQIQSRFKAGVGRGVDLEQAGARGTGRIEPDHRARQPARRERAVPACRRCRATAEPGRHQHAARRRAGDFGRSDEHGGAPERGRQRQHREPARRALGGRCTTLGLSTESRSTAAQRRRPQCLWAARPDPQQLGRDRAHWNFFNGGADQARIRQQANVLSQAADLRDKTCRDTRQTAAIAYNDTHKLTEQLAYLDRNTLAIQKARDAYRQQFDIGQRSLLDLLNAENELYTARRAYANAEYDQGLAFARTHAAMNQLGTQLGVSRGCTAANEASGWAQGEDAPTRCPVVISEVVATDRGELDARAQRLAATAPVATPAAAPASAPMRKP